MVTLDGRDDSFLPRLATGCTLHSVLRTAFPRWTLATSRLAGGCVIWTGQMVIGDLRIPFAFPTSIIRAIVPQSLGFGVLEQRPFLRPAITCGLRLTDHCAVSLI